MNFDSKNIYVQDPQALIVKLHEELKLRKYSAQTSKLYASIIERFLRYGRSPRDFLLLRSDKSRSTMRVYYFALKFYFENVLDSSVWV